MGLLIIFSGLILATTGMLMLIQPRLVMDTLHSLVDEEWLQFVTATSRVVLGSVLLVCAEQTRFPLALQIMGLISLTAGMGITLLPAAAFRHFLSGILKRYRPYARMGSVLLIGAGSFLVYAMF